ncbi:hypothetical protein BRC82_09315 [Halobacteriales archaeon QS_1_67_19]|nr:MAG: hypothetical protein BRC82_09315 [Halobacteriales archaeon QS_1_67_19]
MAFLALTDTELFGRDRSRTVVSVGVAIALFAGSSLAGGIAESSGVSNDWFARFPLAVLASLVAIGAIAAGTAYWNGGLVSSWLVAFASPFGWLSNVLVGAKPAFPEGVVAPLGLAGGIAVSFGTVGYAIGRYIRVRGTENGKNALPDPLLRILLGDEPDQFIRWGTRAGGLFVVAGALIYVTSPDTSLSVRTFEFPIPAGGLNAPFVFGTVTIPAWIGTAMWPAYRNEGLLASWLLLFGPFFGAMLTDEVLVGRLTGSGLLVDGVLVLLGTFVLAVALGTVGFVLGSGLRRASENRRPAS